jgi:hypothetical protein
MDQLLLSDYQQCGYQTDMFTYICQQELKAELFGEFVSYILHVITFGLLFVWFVFNNTLPNPFEIFA